MRAGQAVRLTVDGDADRLSRPRRASVARSSRSRTARSPSRPRCRTSAGSCAPGSFARAEIVTEADQPVGHRAGQRHRRLRRRREGAGRAARARRPRSACDRSPAGRGRSRSSRASSAASPWCVQPGNLVGGQAVSGQAARLAMQKLAEVCIKRPVFATMIVMALVVVGAASWFRLGVDRFPSVDLPTVTRAHRAARRLDRGDGDPGFAEARGADQHDPGHQRAALDLQPRQLASSSSPSI